MTSTDPAQTPPTQAPDAGTGTAPSTDPTPAPDPSTSTSPAASPADQFAALKTLTREQRAELREALDEADGGTADTPPPAAADVAVPPEQVVQVHEVWRQAIGPDGTTKVLVGPDVLDDQGELLYSSPLPEGFRLLPPNPTP